MPRQPLTPFELRLQVRPEEIDEYNHVSNLVYLKWTLKAAGAHSAAVGWPSQRYKEQGQSWIVRSHRITYRRPALLGDEVIITTWVDSFEKYSSVRKYRIERAGDNVLLADAETNWVYVDLNTVQLVRIPEDMKRDFGAAEDE
jgi:acyl-CoA thioester hydrolase